MNGLVAHNTVIKQAEAQIESKLSRDTKQAYMKIVIAGMKYAMNGGADSILAKLKGSEDPVSDIVKASVNIVHLLRRAAKGTMPTNAMVPAMMTLILQGLDYAEHAGMMKVGNAEIARATRMFVETVLPSMGVTPDKFAGLTSQVGGVLKDPAKAQQIQAALAKHQEGMG